MMRQLIIISCQSLILFLPVIYCWTSQSSSSSSSITSCIRRNNCQSLSSSPPILPQLHHHHQTRLFASIQNQEDDVLDVEFEKTLPETKKADDDIDISEDGNDNNKDDDDGDDDDDEDDDEDDPYGLATSLIDVSLETGDPRWKNTRIPFCRGAEYIDCKLAFMVDLEGQSYGIAVPFDDAVAIVIQEPTKKFKSINDKKGDNSNLQTKCIDPDFYQDNEEYAELMEIFAVQVQEQLGDEFRLRKTPKVLTISGGLDKITNDWQDKVITKPYEVEDLLEATRVKDKKEVDTEMESFYEIMKRELGEEEYEKTMNTSDDDIEKELKELMGFFDNPGAHGGNSKEDMEGLDDLMESMKEEIETGEIPEAKEFIPDTENAALKLLGYTFKESGKSYFLVKPLQSCKYMKNYSVLKNDCFVIDGFDYNCLDYFC
jgi:hypothetical protein